MRSFCAGPLPMAKWDIGTVRELHLLVSVSVPNTDDFGSDRLSRASICIMGTVFYSVFQCTIDYVFNRGFSSYFTIVTEYRTTSIDPLSLLNAGPRHHVC